MGGSAEADPLPFHEEDEEEVVNTFAKTSKKSKSSKIPTHLLTLESWNQHKDIDKVAKERGLAKQTIFGHLTKLVSEKEINISDLIPLERLYEMDTLYTSTMNGLSLKEMKEIVEDTYSYEELKLLMVYREMIG